MKLRYCKSYYVTIEASHPDYLTRLEDEMEELANNTRGIVSFKMSENDEWITKRLD